MSDICAASVSAAMTEDAHIEAAKRTRERTVIPEGYPVDRPVVISWKRRGGVGELVCKAVWTDLGDAWMPWPGITDAVIWPSEVTGWREVQSTDLNPSDMEHYRLIVRENLREALAGSIKGEAA